MKASFIKRQVHHPKVVTLCKEIEVWLKKKRAKSGGDTEQKVQKGLTYALISKGSFMQFKYLTA